MECKCVKQAESNFPMEEFRKATQPAIDFMQRYCCPHDKIVIDTGSAELLNGEMAYTVEVPD